MKVPICILLMFHHYLSTKYSKGYIHTIIHSANLVF